MVRGEGFSSVGVLHCKLNHCAGLIKYHLLLNATQQTLISSTLCCVKLLLSFSLHYFCGDLQGSAKLSQKNWWNEDGSSTKNSTETSGALRTPAIRSGMWTAGKIAAALLETLKLSWTCCPRTAGGGQLNVLTATFIAAWTVTPATLPSIFNWMCLQLCLKMQMQLGASLCDVLRCFSAWFHTAAQNKWGRWLHACHTSTPHSCCFSCTTLTRDSAATDPALQQQLHC